MSNLWRISSILFGVIGVGYSIYKAVVVDVHSAQSPIWLACLELVISFLLPVWDIVWLGLTLRLVHPRKVGKCELCPTIFYIIIIICYMYFCPVYRKVYMCILAHLFKRFFTRHLYPPFSIYILSLPLDCVHSHLLFWSRRAFLCFVHQAQYLGFVLNISIYIDE